MKVVATAVSDLHAGDRRLDASYHASEGVQALLALRRWARSLTPLRVRPAPARDSFGVYSSQRLDRLDEVCKPDGIFIPSRFKRIFVDDPAHGAPYLTGGSIMQADPLMGAKLLSRKFTANMEELALRNRMILVTCSGTIGNSVYVNATFGDAVGSPDLLRIEADTAKIPPGYLYAFLNSPTGKSLIEQKTYGAVVPHVEAHHVVDLPIPRLDPAVEERIHALVERAAALRVEASQRLECAQQRLNRDVLGLPQGWRWRHLNEHARAAGVVRFSPSADRLDAFHHVGYVGEAEAVLPAWHPLGDLVEPYQPPLFKRPYTGETGIPFLSGMDLYDAYPKPHMYISRKMQGLDRYIVRAGTILVQRVGQRYGLFGRPTILPHHLDQTAVTEHLIRVRLKNSRDRGFVYTWLCTESGRRLLLKQSFGTSMGVLSEQSFRQMTVPDCPADLRYSFEPEVQAVCDLRNTANALQDQAQALLAETLGMG